ncbi:unnamed protein product [Parascedosporium putredinis]|uniref:Uncharacterized protein n=1 Tax=Parascedosporium putredinis TaxID=1442378 RepID=A0A9P1MCH5_9PEZI|nr:unnamed protein product [Parascedosporium putredinis]CAI7996560.1 unnamed protein product [Parascedosporium putredinis]
MPQIRRACQSEDMDDDGLWPVPTPLKVRGLFRRRRSMPVHHWLDFFRSMSVPRAQLLNKAGPLDDEAVRAAGALHSSIYQVDDPAAEEEGLRGSVKNTNGEL